MSIENTYRFTPYFWCNSYLGGNSATIEKANSIEVNNSSKSVFPETMISLQVGPPNTEIGVSPASPSTTLGMLSTWKRGRGRGGEKCAV
ncbi:hypothetical protein P3L10_007132 [Capsicum annuum]